MSGIYPNYLTFENQNPNLYWTSNVIESLNKEKDKEESLDDLCVDFIEIVSTPIPPQGLDLYRCRHFSELITKLKAQFFLNDRHPFTSIFFDILGYVEHKFLQVPEPNFPLSTSFISFHLFGDTMFELVGVDNHLTDQMHLKILGMLLNRCFSKYEQQLFELILNAHQKLNYPKLVYKNFCSSTSGIQLEIHMDIIQFTFFQEDKFYWLRSVNVHDFASHLAFPCLCIVNTSHNSFFSGKNMPLHKFYLTPFCSVFRDPTLSKLKYFFSEIPLDAIQTLADYLVTLVLRGHTYGEHAPFQNKVIYSFLKLMETHKINLNLDEKENDCLLGIFSELSLNPDYVNESIPKNLFVSIDNTSDNGRIKKAQALIQDEDFIHKKAQIVLNEKFISFLFHEFNCTNQDLCWISLSAFFIRHPFSKCIEILAHNHMKTSEIAYTAASEKVRKASTRSAAYVRQHWPQLNNSKFDLSGNCVIVLNIVPDSSNPDFPNDLIRLHADFIFLCTRDSNCIFHYISLLKSHLPPSKFLEVLNLKFKLQFLNLRKISAEIDSSIISLMCNILSFSDTPATLNKNYGIEVNFNNEKFIFEAKLPSEPTIADEAAFTTKERMLNIVDLQDVKIVNVLPSSPSVTIRINDAKQVPLPDRDIKPADPCTPPPRQNDKLVEIVEIKDLLNSRGHIVIRMYKKIAKDLLTAWSASEHKDLFIKALIERKGKWGFDLNASGCLGFLGQSLGTCLAEYSFKDTQIVRAIVQDIARFFYFFDPSNRDNLSSGPWGDLLPKQDPAELQQRDLLSVSESLQAAQVFFDLKISEFQGRIEHLKYCLCKEKTPSYRIPCYLVAQDLQGIHVQIMEAHFNEENSLVKLSASTEAARYFLRTVAPHSEILQTTAQIAMGDLQNLHHAILEANEPCALVLERKNKSTLTSSNKKRKSEEEDEETQPRKKKKLEGEFLYKGVQYENFEISSAQHAVENFPMANPSNPPSFLLQIPPPAFPNKYSFGFEDFWKMQSLTSLDALESKIRKRQSRLKTLTENIPLNYPLLDRFPTAEDLGKPIHCYNPLLKPYQQREVGKLVQYALKGVSRMLALEMGLGKTYVYGEFIAQMIASKAKGINLVIVPKSILNSVHEELKIVLGLAGCSAWKIHCDNPRNFQHFRSNFSTKVHHAFENGRFQELCLLLPLASYFPAEDLYQSFFKLYEAKNLETWKAFSLVLADRMASFHQCHSVGSPEIFSPITAALEKALKTKFSGIINPSLAQEWIQSIEDAKNTRLTWMGSGKPQPFYPAQQKTTEGFLNPLLHAQFMLAASLLKITDPYQQINAKLYPQEQALQLANFSLDRIVCCETTNSLKNALLRLQDSPSVVVTTYEIAIRNPVADLAKLPFSSIIVDEAHRLTSASLETQMRSEKSAANTWFQSFIQAVHPKAPAVVLVTGTPLQNTFNEMLTLLHIANPGGFDCKTSHELVQMNNLVIKKLITHSKEEIEEDFFPLLTYVIRSFAHFEAFRQQIVRPLIEQMHKEDSEVIHDWQGRIPERIDVTLTAQIKEPTRSLIEKILTTQHNFLESNHGVKRILLHPDLAFEKIKKLEMEDPKVKRILKQAFSTQQKCDEWVEKSPLLNTLVHSESLMRVIKNKQKALVITEYVAAAKILKKTLQYKFSEAAPEIKVFHGDLSLEKRKKYVHWFKTPSDTSSKILILMQNVGGLGLNLPEASDVFMISMGWNPAKDDQAIARALRVGSLGQRQVTWINYGVYPQDHSNVVKAKKRAWEKFFWNDRQGIYEQFKNWLDVLRESCLQSKLNECKNLEVAKRGMHSIEKILSDILQSTSDQLLQQAFEAVLPKKKIVLETVHAPIPPQVVKPSPPMQIAIEQYQKIPIDRCTILPLAEPDWSKQEKSYDKALKMGAALLNQRNQNTIAWSESVQKMKNDCHSKAQRDEIRTRKKSGPEIAINLWANDVNLKIVSEKYSIEVFSYTREEGFLKCYSVNNPSQQPIIRLLMQERKKPNGETYRHYDLLILNDDL
jgi:SNF2 family DNA or RNA helicase